MNLRQIELFLAIAENGSFSRGAEAVTLTQSTVSQHIAALEAEIGVSLFDRTGKGVFLTAGGQLFMQHARRIVAEREALLQGMAEFRGLQQARLTIGASNIPANYLIPPLLPVLHAQHPGISLTMITGDSSDILDRLAASEIELAMVGNRFARKQVDYRPLISDLLVLVVGPGHPWQSRGRILLEELMAEPLLVRERGSGSGQTLENALRTAGCDPGTLQVAARLGSNEAVLQAVATGFGCAFVSELSIRQRQRNNQFYVIDVEGLRIERQLWLAQLQTRTLSPAARVVAELLTQRYHL